MDLPTRTPAARPATDPEPVAHRAAAPSSGPASPADDGAGSPRTDRVPTPSGPEPAAEEPVGGFAALRIRNYRLFAASQVVNNSGIWMQRIAQDWLVLTLTGSVTAVGIVTALQFAPVVLFGLLGGVLADRHSKRVLLIITHAAQAVLAGILTVLTFTGSIQVGHVYAVALALGLVTAVDNPSRTVFVSELVGRRHLRSAVSINSSVFQLGGLVGPALGGGLIAAFGEGWAFLVNTVGCLAVVAMLLMLRADQLHREPTVARAPGQLRAGLRYVRDHLQILWTIVLVGTVGFLALNLPVVLTGFADRVFVSGAGGFGTYNAMIAVGGILGAITASRRREARLRTVVGLTALLGSSLVLAAAAPSAAVFCVVLVGAGMTTLVLLIGAHLLVQLGVAPLLRGRVMALYVMMQLGGRAAGGPAIGWVAEVLGPRLALLAAGVALLLVALVVSIVLARTWDLRVTVQVPSRHHRQVLTITPRTAPSTAPTTKTA